MKNKQRHYGFSLIEVLFAMLILTMGIIFVAGQFPLGLANARKIAEETRSEVDAHNAAIMAELQIGALDLKTYIGPDSFINDDGNVHYLPRPNARQLNHGGPILYNPMHIDIIMDDPLLLYYDTLPTFPQEYFENKSSEPKHPVNFYPTEFSIGMSLQNNLLPMNIGKIVSPPVDETDQDVQAFVNLHENTGEVVNHAIFEVATSKRNFSTAQFYQHIGNNRFRLFIFTLRSSNKRLQYALQDLSVANPQSSPQPFLSDNQGRYFPVPWAITLPATIITSFIGAGTKDNPEYGATDLIPINEAISNILRPGSILIDADIENTLTAWDDNGYVYEVAEVGKDNDGFFMRLRTVLEDNLTVFWVFPPGRDPDTGDWANSQPVVKVTQKIVAFNVKTVFFSDEFHE